MLVVLEIRTRTDGTETERGEELEKIQHLTF